MTFCAYCMSPTKKDTYCSDECCILDVESPNYYKDRIQNLIGILKNPHVVAEGIVSNEAYERIMHHLFSLETRLNEAHMLCYHLSKLSRHLRELRDGVVTLKTNQYVFNK